MIYLPIQPLLKPWCLLYAYDGFLITPGFQLYLDAAFGIGKHLLDGTKANDELAVDAEKLLRV